MFIWVRLIHGEVYAKTYGLKCFNVDRRTPFHADVFNSFSWSANVCGQKRWILYPPGLENKLKDSLNNLPYDIGNIPEVEGYYEVIQGPGDAIFVPSGWHHQVWNLEDTISVNHNWINGCNIKRFWSSLVENLQLTKAEIEDCKDMDNYLEHCQIMLKASFGMDFETFFEFLEFIAKKRLTLLQNKKKEMLFHGHILGFNHAVFDLSMIEAVLKEFINHNDVAELCTQQLLKANNILIEIGKLNISNK